MSLFKNERKVITEATETAKKSINTALIVAGVAVALATVALVILAVK